MNHSPELLEPLRSSASDAQIDSEAVGISVADIFRALVKNKWLILACTVICLVCAGVYVVIKKPVYEASASIRIDPSRAGSLGLSDLLSLAGGESSDQTQTEMAILKSDQVAIATLRSLTPDQFHAYTGFDKQSISFDQTDKPLSRQEESIIGVFKKSLGVKQVEGTQLVGITFRNGNRTVAAVIINSMIAAYTRQNFDSRYNSVNQVRVWLSAQMDELRERAANAQQKLADFQEKNNILGADVSSNTTFDRLKLLNEDLTQAEGNRIVKEAQMRAAMTGDPAVLASLLPDPQLQSLQTQEANLYTQYVQLSTKFGSAYPPLVDLKQQLAQLKAQIAQVVTVTSGRLKEDYEAARGTEDLLRKEYTQETEQAFALNRTQADFAVLLAEGTSSRDLYNTLQYKLQQAVVDAGLNSVNTMIVDRARVPIDPVEPNKPLILAFGLVLGLTTGVGASLLRESMSDEVQSVAQIENRTGLVSLATVPHVAPLAAGATVLDKEGKSVPASHIISVREPRSRGAEAYRTLRNSILLSAIDRPVQTIMVTSALPGDGKSFTSANYAVVLAQKGSRVLLVDADLRRPALHRQFGVPNKGGLSDQIVDSGEEVIFRTPVPELPNLHFLPAGVKLPLPSEALGSDKFHSIVEGWKKQYDNIVLDTAPILTVSDSLPLSSWVDSVVLVVRSGVTPLKALLQVKSNLTRAHARIAGVLFNDVSEVSKDYGYYGYYGKDTNEYYK